MELSAGGAPAGVVDDIGNNDGFAGVACEEAPVAALVGVFVLDELAKLLPNIPPG